MKMIGISGRRGSGKSTLADNIVQVFFDPDRPVIHINFADALKKLVVDSFIPEVSIKFLDRQDAKNILLPSGKTIREALQIIGCAYRKIDPDYWIVELETNLNEKQFQLCEPCACYCLISDVRFPNEADYILNSGGLLIRLLRNPSEDIHESETALDNYLFKNVIDNRNLTVEQTLKLAMPTVKEYLKPEDKT